MKTALFDFYSIFSGFLVIFSLAGLPACSKNMAPEQAPVSVAPPLDSSADASASSSALKQRLQSATADMQSWDQAERARLGNPSSEDGTLIQLPLNSESPLAVPSATERTYQYAKRTVVFDSRRAAKFLALMRPDLAPLQCWDMSMADGSTPSDSQGLRHPAGAHVGGISADLSYAGSGLTPPANAAQVDMEGTAWIMYSLLQSPNIESIYTAYKAPLVAQAEAWYSAGIIRFETLTRFRNDLWQDTSLNHGTHLHINTASRPGLLLTPANDFYRCYHATVGSFGTIWSLVSGCLD
jgi:hypothetical protein